MRASGAGGCVICVRSSMSSWRHPSNLGPEPERISTRLCRDRVKCVLEPVRALCLALPETTERLSHGSPAWFIRDKKTFVMYVDDHHGDGRPAPWGAAPPRGPGGPGA